MFKKFFCVQLRKFQKLNYFLIFKLSKHFKELGATHAFDSAKADFSGINSNPDGLHISKVFHKAVVEINEEGTEAAAATGLMLGTRMLAMQLETHEFHCNRPFIFVINENTHNNILFMGKYVKPN